MEAEAGERAGKAAVAKDRLAYQLQQYLDLDGVLSCCERLWPAWADNGCRMIELVRPPAAPRRQCLKCDGSVAVHLVDVNQDYCRVQGSACFGLSPTAGTEPGAGGMGPIS